jgi:hypothetical protein
MKGRLMNGTNLYPHILYSQDERSVQVLVSVMMT